MRAREKASILYAVMKPLGVARPRWAPAYREAVAMPAEEREMKPERKPEGNWRNAVNAAIIDEMPAISSVETKRARRSREIMLK